MKNSDLSLGGPQFPTINGDGTVTIADSGLLLSGDYSRDGDDLVLTGQDGQQLQIVEYFSQGTPPALISSDGKMLGGDTVVLLAGPQAPGQYAQSTGGQFGDAIGQVESLSGSATAQRPDGTTVELTVGAHVFQGDVVSAGADWNVGITFLDKTVFTIADSATMVLNEMVYNASGSSNSMLFNLIGGTAAFVAGAVAKTGDMKIETPVAVMAIRGTEPFASCDASSSCYFGGAEGKYDLLHKVLGQVLATVDDPSLIVTLDSANGTPSIDSPSPAQQAAMGRVFNAMRKTIDLLDKRLEDGEDPVREAGTGSPDFADGNFLEDIGGFIFRAFTSLLSQESLERTTEETIEDVPFMPEPILTAKTDEHSSFIIEVITEDDVLGLGPLAQVVGASVVPPGLGTATPLDGTSVIYDPGLAYNSLAEGENANVRVSIDIDLGNGTIQTETAFVTVLGVNDMPTADPDETATDEGALVNIDVLSNDTDPDASDDLTVSQATVTSGLGVVTIAADGHSINYDPAGAYEFLSAGETAMVVISYQISDGNGGFATSTATVTVTGLNDGPTVGEADDTGNVRERADGSGGENIAVLVSTGIIAFSDADLGDSHAVSVTPGGAGYLGALAATVTNATSDDGAGEVSWQFSVNDADLDYLAATDTLVQVYTIKIDDGNGGVTTQDVTINIRGRNDTPVIAGEPDTTGSVTERDIVINDDVIFTPTSTAEPMETEALSIAPPIGYFTDGDIEFADVDLADAHTVSVTENGTDFRGSLTVAISDPSQSDGSGTVSWSYTAAFFELDDLAEGQILTQVYTITIDDGQGGIVTQDVTITINGTNDAPVITSGRGAGSVTEVADGAAGENSQTLTADGTLDFGDVDLADGHTVSVADGASGFRGTMTASIADASQGDGAGTISWLFSINDSEIDDLAAGQSLTQIYTITVDDGNGGTDTQRVTITINGTNDVPTITGAAAKGSVSEFAEDAEVEGDAHDPVTGTVDFADVDLTDGYGVSVTALGGGYFGVLTAVVGDVSTGDGAGQVDWAFNINDSEINHLGASDVLVQKYRLIIDDGNGGTVSRVVTITINGSNDSPIIASSAGAGSVTELDDGDAGENSQLLSTKGMLNFGDVDLSDGHTVSVEAQGTHYRGSLSSTVSDPSQGDGTGKIAWTFNINDAALDDLRDGQMFIQTYVITVDDGNGGTSSQTVVIKLFGSNDGPVIITADDMGAVTEIADKAAGENLDDLTATGSVSVADDDLGDVNTVSVTANGNGFRGMLEAVVSETDPSMIDWTFTVSDAAIDDLAAGETRVQLYTLTVTDSAGSTVPQTVEITITGTNDAPVITSAAGSGSVRERADGSAGENTATLSTGGSLNFTDVDLADGHSVGVAENSAGFRGDLTATITDASLGDGSGKISWTFRVKDSDVDDLAAGQSLTQIYTVTVTDPTGATSSQLVTITINGTNDAPDITTGSRAGQVTEIDDNATGETTQDLTATGKLNFVDVDLNDEHSVSVTSSGSDFRGDLVAAIVNPSLDDGAGQIRWTFTVNDGDIDDLAAGETLTQVYFVNVTDPGGATDSQRVTITINGINDAPVITGAADSDTVTELTDLAANENSLLHTVNGTIAFGDVDLADSHTVSVTPASAGFLGDLTASISNDSLGDGLGQIAWTFKVNDSVLDSLSATDTLFQLYTIEVDDGNGGTDTQTVTITIQGSNDAPIITSADQNGTVDELLDGAAGENTAPLQDSGTIVFGDVDANDTHSVSVSTIGSAPRGNLTAALVGTTVTWTYSVIGGELDDLAEGESVIQSYRVTVSDGQGGTDSRIIDIELTGTNDVAIITGTSTGTVIEDDAIDTIGGLLDVVDPDIRQATGSEAAFNAAVMMGTYGALTISAGGVWSYELDNSLATTDSLGFGDSVTDSFTVSTIDGTEQVINVTVEGVGFDFEFADFGGNSGSSEFKSLDAGDIESIDVDLLITPMPLTVISGGKEVANKVNATSTDLGIGAGQDIAFDEGVRFEFVTEAEAMNQNNISTFAYASHISLVLFQAEISAVQGDQSQTVSIQLRVVNADDDNNFDTMNDAGDVVVPLSMDDVTVTIASGNAGVVDIQQFGDVVFIIGLQEGDVFTIDSSTPFNRVEVENASETFGGNTFEVGLLGFNMPEELILTGDGTTAALIGADSNDTLNSGANQQELTGGKGVDLFVFDGTASTGALADIIIDYEANVDVIDLSELFDVAPGDFNEASVEEFARYLSGNDNDGSGDPSGTTGDLFIDADGAANGENFILLAHSNTATDSIILKVDDGTDIGYVTIV